MGIGTSKAKMRLALLLKINNQTKPYSTTSKSKAIIVSKYLKLVMELLHPKKILQQTQLGKIIVTHERKSENDI